MDPSAPTTPATPPLRLVAPKLQLQQDSRNQAGVSLVGAPFPWPFVQDWLFPAHPHPPFLLISGVE